MMRKARERTSEKASTPTRVPGHVGQSRISNKSANYCSAVTRRPGATSQVSEARKVRQRRAVWPRPGIGAEDYRAASTPDSAAFAAGQLTPDEQRGTSTQHSPRITLSLARPRKPT